MPRCTRPARPPSGDVLGCDDVDAELAEFYDQLPLEERKRLLSVEKRALFERIRANYCSRCFGLFVLRYEELRNSDALECPACAEFYAGLVVQDEKESERGKEKLTLEELILQGQPFATFAESRARERERELQFMAGDICGSGWVKRKGGESMCALHTAPVPLEALLEFWEGLPPEHCNALFRLRDEDFAAEVDAQLRYTLKICRDCRSNVMREYRQLKCGRGGVPAELEVCKDHFLCVAEGLVSLEGKGAAHFFERAEEVEECKVVDGELGGGGYGGEVVRHAETPELAREALADSAALIFKGQVEVAFREQTAGHNALLLFVHLALGMMEEKLANAFKELRAKRAEAELLELVAKDEKDKESKRVKRRAKKAAGRRRDDATEIAPMPPRSPSPPPPCRRCEELQSGGSEAGGSTPRAARTPARAAAAAPRSPPRPPASPRPKSPPALRHMAVCLHSAGESPQGDPAPERPALGVRTGRASPAGAARSGAGDGDWETIQGGRRRSAASNGVPRRASSLGSSGSASTGSSPLATRTNSPERVPPQPQPRAPPVAPSGASPPTAHRLAAARSAAGLNPWLVAAPPPPPRGQARPGPAPALGDPPPPPPPRRAPPLPSTGPQVATPPRPTATPAPPRRAWGKLAPPADGPAPALQPAPAATAWASLDGLQPQQLAAAQAWSPWGRMDGPALGLPPAAWHKAAAPPSAMDGVFSLFAHSPVPAGRTCATPAPAQDSAYHLFGNPTHPANPLQTLLPTVQ